MTFYNSLLSYTINFDVLQLSTILYTNQQLEVLQLSTILYNQLRRFTTLYYPLHPTSKFYNYLVSYIQTKQLLAIYTTSLLYYIINFDVLPLSTILYNQLRSFTTPYYLLLAISKFYNSLLSYITNFDVLQLFTILYNQLRSLTTLYYFIKSTSTFYNSLLSYAPNF